MAAAEYYQHQMPFANGPPSHQPPVAGPYLSSPPSHVPPQKPPPPSSHVPPQGPPPPPYQVAEMPAGKPYSYRPGDQQYQRNSFSHPDRPQATGWTSSYGQLPPHQVHMPIYPQASTHQYLQPQPFHTPPSHFRPYHENSPHHGNTPSTNLAQGYSSEPEPGRRRRSRKKSSSRSSATDGFLGAAGGGLIGDLIFPGLGTIGGAVAGYFGGKEHGKHRKRRESRNRQEKG